MIDPGIIRVFPRRTNVTPDDPMTWIGEPGLFHPPFDEVHVSVTFSWDMPDAVRIADSWRRFGKPVKVGGPATGMRGEAFTPGMYIKPGYVITSRGCPNRCWFCSVWKRDGDIRELPITEGWNVLDDNLLACSEQHIMAVFDMLKEQKHQVEFTGGLEAARLTSEIADELERLNPKQIFLAYDTPDDLPHIERARQYLWERELAGDPHHTTRVYVLIGYPRDTMDAATNRLNAMLGMGLMPMAMLYRDSDGMTDPEWRKFQRTWARPAIIMSGGGAGEGEGDE